MTSLFANMPRLGRRETIAFALAGFAMAIALACAATRMHSVTKNGQNWAGDLVAAAPTDVAPLQSMSSASLVVAKSELSLPPVPAKPVVRVRLVCDSADKLCVARPATLAVPPRRPASIAAAQSPQPDKVEPHRPGFLESLNPLDHLPDLSGAGRPFAAASRVVTGWVKWF